MSLRIRDRVVVFDYGEVISLSPSSADRAALLEVAGVDAVPFWVAYERYRDALDRGDLSIPEYWSRIAGDVGATWTPSDVQRLWAADFRSWISVEPGTIDLLAELHEGGTRLAILSNAGFDFASAFRFSPMARYFERIFVSAEMHALKPEPAIYLEVAESLGITPTQLVFIDNKSANTEGAAELGITVHHFTGVERLTVFLRSLAE